MTRENPKLIEAINEFKKQFGKDPEIAVFAPGRVNLIGEHVDYNMGFVLPFALPFKTFIVGARKPGSESTIVSCSMKTGGESSPVKFIISPGLKKGVPEWANYVKGTIFQFLEDLPQSLAFDAVIASDVPLGSGLSSSAALEVATATFLEKLCKINISPVAKAKRCQKAEHTFADTPCGLMDQYISAMGRVDNLLCIDCRTQEYKLVPYGKSGDRPVLLVTNSCVSHSLSGSEYPVRVRQCNTAVGALQKKYPGLSSLRDATMPMLEEVKTALEEVIYRRARHCITENIRTLDAVAALERGDFFLVGKLMTESHNSLRDDYEVSCDELDFLVDIALQAGALGSRMTGGGFGGCTVTLVEKANVDVLQQRLKTAYREKFATDCICYLVTPSEGAGPAALPQKPLSAYLLPGAIVAAGIAVLVGLVLSRR